MSNPMFGDWSGVGNWWNQVTGNVGNFINDVIRASAAGPGNPRAAVPTNMRTPNNMRPQSGARDTSAIERAAQNQANEVRRLGGADNLRNMAFNAAGRIPNLQQPTGFMGMSDAELMQFLLGGGGGGGAPQMPDLSGFEGMVDDVNRRRDQLNIRKWQQRKFLNDLFDAADAEALATQSGIGSRIEEGLASDAERRAAEMALIRGEDQARLAEANAARGALGAGTGEDLSSAVAQNAVAGIGAAGSISERDARIQESLQNQQIARQRAGLVPMQQMATQDLMSGYEDRLSALASERAAIKAQMAQTRAAASMAPRGGGGPSVSEKLAALGFIQDLNAPGEAASAPGALGFLQQSQAADSANARMYNDLAAVASRLLSAPQVSRINPTAAMSPGEALQALMNSDPNVARLVQRNANNAAWIIQYMTSAGKAP
jgi:hypothetical protein